MQGGALRGVVQGMTKWIGANKGVIVSGLDTFLKDTTSAVRTAIPLVVQFAGGFADGVRDVTGVLNDMKPPRCS